MKKFGIRFEETEDNKIDLHVFETPFDICPEEVPDSSQLELIRSKYNNGFIELQQIHQSREIPCFVHKNAMTFESQFSTTYQCEQIFSKSNNIKKSSAW